MKILIVAAYFPPRNIVASYRPYSWAKYWTDAGHDVTVLTVEYPITKDSLDCDLSKFRVIKIKDPVPGRQKSVVIENEESCQKNEAANKKSLYGSMLMFAKKWYVKHIEPTGIIAGMNFPNFWDVWAGRAIKAVKNEKFDAVVSTGGPYSVHRVGLYLRKHGNTKKWICDWRDLWTKSQFCTGLKIFQGYQKRLERKFHENADLVTTVSEGLKEQLEEITDTPVEIIYNGFQKDECESILKKTRQQYEKFTLSYVGTIYNSYQNIEPFFAAISMLVLEGKISSKNFCFQFASAYSDEYVWQFVKKYKLEDYYVFLGKISHEKALEVEYNSDGVLFFEYNNPKVKGVLSGKIFECLYVAKDVMCIGNSEISEVDSLIINTEAGTCFGSDSEYIKQYVWERIQNRGGIRQRKASILDSFDRSKQAERLLCLMIE